MKTLKLVILIVLPAITVYLCISNPSRDGRFLFSLFMLVFIFERIWESLYTAKNKNVDVIEGDWTLPISVLSYIALCVFCLLEFYATHRAFSVIVSILSMVAYIGALALRLWAVKTLGDQWSVHIIGSDKLQSSRRVILSGPYAYIRHPVYLGIIVEQISLPLIANLYVTAFLMAIFSIPFQFFKSRLEEKQMSLWLGAEYKNYVNKVPGFNFIRSIFYREVCR